MPDPTPADLAAGAEAVAAWRYVPDAGDGCPSMRSGTPHEVAEVVLRAVLPARDARVRAQVAGEIIAHADRYAGKPLNHPMTVLRRHLLVAARIAAGPPTDDDLAHIAAVVVAHATPPEETDHAQ